MIFRRAGAGHRSRIDLRLGCSRRAVAALIWRPRLVVRQIKWELVLLLLVLLLCMTPTAGLFRWSFRWLPFFHLVQVIGAGSLASQTGVTDSGYSGGWTCRLDRRRGVDLPYNGFVRFSAHLDSDWTGCGLVVFRVPAARFRISVLATRRDHVLRVTRHVSLHPDKRRSSQIQFFSRAAQTCAARSAAALPQCVSMGRAYLLYSKQT